jgi:hypothetical protein
MVSFLGKVLPSAVLPARVFPPRTTTPISERLEIPMANVQVEAAAPSTSAASPP